VGNREETIHHSGGTRLETGGRERKKGTSEKSTTCTSEAPCRRYYKLGTRQSQADPGIVLADDLSQGYVQKYLGIRGGTQASRQGSNWFFLLLLGNINRNLLL
jgi:hypothetical protein